MRISDWSSDVCSSDLVDEAGTLAGRVVAVVRDAGQQTRGLRNDRCLVAPSLRWRPGADTDVKLLGVIQRDTSASSQQFLPLVATILAPSKDREISNRTFLGDYDYDTLEQRSVSATLIVDHRFSYAISVSSRARYKIGRAHV